ncbi:MAG: hypothetical protein SPJ13_07345 [Bacteroidales bacterium]|nr:hypothetical protein [Bacteroidales bacterium]
MKKNICFSALAAAAMLGACGNDAARPAPADTTRDEWQMMETSVPYEALMGYAVRNGVRTDSIPTLIRSEEEFDRYFQKTAASKSATVTRPDFGKSVVIAIILDETGIETDLEPKELTATATDLALKSTVTLGKAATGTMQPFLLLMVDRNHDRPRLQTTFEMK